MSSILFATSEFKPGASPRQVVDVVLLVRIFGKVRRGQRIVAEHARAIVAVGSGELQQSIEALEPFDTFQEIVGVVVASAGHAGFVEFGTGLRGIGTYPYPLPKEGVPYTGGWVYDYKKQQWVGMPAQPFMRPALDIGRAEIIAEFRG
jgi:HK97 gp10 family phage protein